MEGFAELGLPRIRQQSGSASKGGIDGSSKKEWKRQKEGGCFSSLQRGTVYSNKGREHGPANFDYGGTRLSHDES
eukprot:403258-Hanusia_phi.AAC.1